MRCTKGYTRIDYEYHDSVHHLKRQEERAHAANCNCIHTHRPVPHPQLGQSLTSTRTHETLCLLLLSLRSCCCTFRHFARIDFPLPLPLPRSRLGQTLTLNHFIRDVKSCFVRRLPPFSPGEMRAKHCTERRHMTYMCIVSTLSLIQSLWYFLRVAIRYLQVQLFITSPPVYLLT